MNRRSWNRRDVRRMSDAMLAGERTPSYLFEKLGETLPEDFGKAVVDRALRKGTQEKFAWGLWTGRHPEGESDS